MDLFIHAFFVLFVITICQFCIAEPELTFTVLDLERCLFVFITFLIHEKGRMDSCGAGSCYTTFDLQSETGISVAWVWG